MTQSLRLEQSWVRRFRKYYLSRWQLYLLLTLPIVYLILFDYIPMAGAQIAFRKFDFRYGIWHSPWVGFENFRSENCKCKLDSCTVEIS